MRHLSAKRKQLYNRYMIRLLALLLLHTIIIMIQFDRNIKLLASRKSNRTLTNVSSAMIWYRRALENCLHVIIIIEIRFSIFCNVLNLHTTNRILYDFSQFKKQIFNLLLSLLNIRLYAITLHQIKGYNTYNGIKSINSYDSCFH